jgi:2-oxoisovalerate dehydrogenase E1 component
MSLAMINSKRTKKTDITNNKASLNREDLKQAYRLMYESRVLDEKMLILIRQGKSYFHIGCMGHEAIQVACGMAMAKGRDFLFPYYRDQALCMTLGQTAYECLLSFFACAEDPHGGGRQMPMHYGNARLNIPTSSSSTGTQFLQALGSAFASKRLFAAGDPLGVTVVTTGDGTTSQGEFYEAISWAAREQAPIVFLVENNRYAISVPIKDQRPGAVIADNFKSFHGLNVVSVNGCDLEESHAVMVQAIERARSGHGPTLVDADVVRLLPHSSSDDDKKYRDAADLAYERTRDPIVLMRKFLLDQNIYKPAELEKLEHSIKAFIDDESDRALKAALPKPEDATTHVWAEAKELPEPPLVVNQQDEPVVMVDAINRALKEGLKADERVLVFGQDVAHGKGGVFTATRGLTAEFGADRCFNAPLAEASIVGVAIGYALRGFRPIPEIQFGDYIWTAMMQIRNELATIRYRSNNHYAAPVVIRVPVGGYIHGGLCHSQNIEATFAHIPGLKIALPSTAIDAYGLLKSAMISEDPVLFLEHKALYRQSFARSVLPKNTDYHLPFGKGCVRKSGDDVTVVTYGILVQRALEASEILLAEGVSVEVIDLRTIVPFDRDLVFSSVKKTGKVLVLHEDMRFMGFGAEVASDIAENCFMSLDAPVKRLAAKDTPVPYSPELESMILPQTKDILIAIRELASF